MKLAIYYGGDINIDLDTVNIIFILYIYIYIYPEINADDVGDSNNYA